MAASMCLHRRRWRTVDGAPNHARRLPDEFHTNVRTAAGLPGVFMDRPRNLRRPLKALEMLNLRISRHCRGRFAGARRRFTYLRSPSLCADQQFFFEVT